MKKSATILLILSSLFLSKASFSQWSSQNSGTLRGFDKVFFASPTIAYAVPFNGPVFKSVNGGSSWDSLSSLEVNGSVLYENSISFVNDSVGFISTNNGSNARLYRTVNGGSSWNNVSPSSSVQGVFKVQFLTSQLGYAYGNNGFGDSIWFTDNGGSSWVNRGPGQSISNGIGYGIQMFFVNDSTGYLAGNDGTFGYRAVILKTNNYGQSWDADTLTLNSYGHRIFFPTKDTGFLVSQMSGIYRTVNGGTNWDTISSFSILNSVTDIHFLNGTTGFISTENSIYKSSDGGKNWSLQYSGTKMLSDIHFNKNFAGLAAGDSGLILKINHGLSIKQKIPQIEHSIYPNPAAGLLKIAVESKYQSADIQLQLFNHLGSLILTKNISETIDVTALPAGIYFYRLSSSDRPETAGGKLIIQH